MSWGYAAAAVGSALIANNAANKQAKAISNAAGQSDKVALDIFKLQRKDNEPFLNTGTNALYTLASLDGVEYKGAPGTVDERRATAMDRFFESPDYTFRVNEGIDALDKSAAARGRLQSGSHVESVLDYAGNTAAGEYQNWKNSLRSTAGQGQVAVSNSAIAGNNYSNTVGNNALTSGLARSSSYGAKANIANGTMQNLLYAYGRN